MEIAALVDMARARDVSSMTFTSAEGASVSFVLHPKPSPPDTKWEADAEFAHVGHRPPDLRAARATAAAAMADS